MGGNWERRLVWGGALGPYTFLAKILVLRGQVAIARKIYDEILCLSKERHRVSSRRIDVHT